MKVFVNEILPDGMSIEGKLDPVSLNLNTEEINFISPISVKCFLTRTKDDLFAKCDLSAIAQEYCSRCLEAFEVEMKRQIDLYYELYGQLSIDFDTALKEEIIMDYPIRKLCKHDCKGLCVNCGMNLNQGQCSCKNAK